jgi:hypothetical protein
MGIDPAAVLALISALAAQVADLQAENAQLRAALVEKAPDQA